MTLFGHWSSAEASAQIGADAEPRWHPCICGAEYRSRRAALRCCSDRFDAVSLPPIEANEATDDDVRQALGVDV